MPNVCAVLNCSSRGIRDDVSFFRIPSIYGKSKKGDPRMQRRREAWIAAINRSDLTETKLNNEMICSKHFVEGKPAKLEDENHPDWAPTQNMGYEEEEGNAATCANRKRMKVEPSVDVMAIKQEITDIDIPINIKEEVDDAYFSNNSKAKDVSIDVDCDSTIPNHFIKQEADMSDDQHFSYIKGEEIDIKDESFSWSTESCGDANVDYGNLEYDSPDEINSTASENHSECFQVDPDYQKAYSSTLPEVTMDMIHDFYIQSYLLAQSKGAKTTGKSNEKYGDEAIEYVQFLRQNNRVTLKCKVIPNQETKEKIYNTTVVINEQDQKIELCECVDCTNVEEQCKHAMAFLYWLHRRTEEPPPRKSECYWKEPINLGGKQFVTCKDFGEVPPSFQVDASNFLELFIQNAPKDCKAPILKYFRHEPSADLHKLMIDFVKGDGESNVDSFINFCQDKITVDMCYDAFKDTKQYSRGELWLELRYGRITSSTLYEASRKDPRGTLTDIILGILNPFDTNAMRREQKLKKGVLEEVEKLRNIHITPAGIKLQSDYPIFAATADALTDEHCILVKCPWNQRTVTKYVVENKIKEKFYCQTMLQLHFYKKQKGLFCVAAPDFVKSKNLQIIDVSYDKDYLMEKLNVATEYWRKNIFPLLLKSCKD